MMEMMQGPMLCFSHIGGLPIDWRRGDTQLRLNQEQGRNSIADLRYLSTSNQHQGTWPPAELSTSPLWLQ